MVQIQAASLYLQRPDRRSVLQRVLPQPTGSVYVRSTGIWTSYWSTNNTVHNREAKTTKTHRDSIDGILFNPAQP